MKYLSRKNKFNNYFKNYNSTKLFEDSALYNVVVIDKDKNCHHYSSLKNFDKSNKCEYYISNLNIKKGESYLKTGLVKVMEDNSKLDISLIKKNNTFLNERLIGMKYGIVTGIMYTDLLECQNSEKNISCSCSYIHYSREYKSTSKTSSEKLCIPVYIRVVLLD